MLPGTLSRGQRVSMCMKGSLFELKVARLQIAQADDLQRSGTGGAWQIWERI